MKSLLASIALAAAALAASPALGQSQHPRIGELATFTFQRDSARLAVYADAAAGRELGEVAAWARENPDGLLVLDGHADRRGTPMHNLRLSLDRAKVVRDKLLEAGVDPAQIIVAAYGERHAAQNQRDRKVVVWGTRAGFDAIVKRAHVRGRVLLTYLDLDRVPAQPAPVAGR